MERIKSFWFGVQEKRKTADWALKEVYIFQICYGMVIFSKWINWLIVSDLGYKALPNFLNGKLILVNSSAEEMVMSFRSGFSTISYIAIPVIVIMGTFRFIADVNGGNSISGSMENFLKKISIDVFRFVKATLRIWLGIGFVIYAIVVFTSSSSSMPKEVNPLFIFMFTSIVNRYVNKNWNKIVGSTALPIFAEIKSGHEVENAYLLAKESIKVTFDNPDDSMEKSIYHVKIKYINKPIVFVLEDTLYEEKKEEFLKSVELHKKESR